MKALLIAAVLATVPMAAAALSCKPPSVQAAFLKAQADAGRFVIVQGQLDLEKGQVSPTRKLKAPRKTKVVRGQLTGSSLSAKGFATPYNKPVSVVLACYGPWCAQVKQGAQVLAFVEVTGRGNVIAMNPCGGYLFHSPSRKMLRDVQGCFAGKSCKPSR